MQGITAMKTPEYIEAPKTQENFESGMKALFQIVKDATPCAKKPKEETR
jgi:hypothetical protein